MNSNKYTQKTNIALISTYGYPLYDVSLSNQGIGGTEVQLYYLVKCLKDKYSISVVVSDYGQGSVIEHDGVKFYRAMNLEKKLKNYLAAPFLFLRALERTQAEIYITSPAGPEFYLTALYCVLRNKKYIHRVAHESETDGTVKEKSVIVGVVHRWSLRKASARVVQTEAQRKQLRNHYHLDSVAISNGFPLLKNLDSTKESILWVARAVPWKRPEVFFEVTDHFPNEVFIMICSGKGDYYEGIRQEADKRDNIRFISHVDFHEIQNYYNQAKLFLSTSEKEGFPNTFIQACLGGVPIVSLGVDPDGFMEKYNTGIVVDNDIEVYLTKVRMLLENTQVWEEMAHNAQTYVSRNHNIEETTKKWIQLLDTVV